MSNEFAVNISTEKLLNKYKGQILEHHGALSDQKLSISSPENASIKSILFIHNNKNLNLIQNKCGVLVTNKVIYEEAKERGLADFYIIVKNSEWFMADFFHEQIQTTPPISHVNSSVLNIPKSTFIAKGVALGNNISIGENSYIGPNVVIEEGAKIGNNTFLHANVFIGKNCILGNFCEVQPNTTIGAEGFGYTHDGLGNFKRIPHLGHVVIEDYVHIGSNCSIDRGTLNNTIIKKQTKIDNLCHIAHNCEIGESSLVTAQFGMAGSSKIGKYFICGGKTSVSGHITLGDGINVAGLSGVNKSLEKPGKYGGYPIQPLQDFLKNRSLITKLNNFRKDIKKLKDEVFKT